MKSPVGAHKLSSGAVVRVFTDNDHDGYGLEITHEGRTVTYDAGHSTREVHAFLTLLT